MSRHVVINGRELSMNDAGFIDPNSEWSVTVGEDGSVEVNRLDLKVENAKLRELCATVIDDWMSKVCPTFPFCEYGGEYQDCTDETCGNQIYRQMARELGVEV